MAQNITLLGASYTDVPAVELPKTGGGTATFTDTTPTTASASDVSQGKYFFTASGVLTLGTNQGGSGSVTQDQDGFIVLPPDVSGGGSSYTLIGSFEVTASTSSTTAEAVYNYASDALWASSSMLYVRIRDKAGKRAGYFYGSDNFFLKDENRDNASMVTQGGRAIIRYTSSNGATVYFGGTTTGYGVFASNIQKVLNGYELGIYKRYNSNYSLTVDGTFTVEVYSLKWPDNISPFV